MTVNVTRSHLDEAAMSEDVVKGLLSYAAPHYSVMRRGWMIYVMNFEQGAL